MKNLLTALPFLLILVACYDNSGHVVGKDLTLHWTFLNSTDVAIGIEWQRQSFVALMIGTNMNKNDLWLCSMEPNTDAWAIADRWSPYPSPPKNDTDPSNGGKDDFYNTSASYDGNKLMCHFSRKLDTGDITDSPLKKGTTFQVCSIDSTSKNLMKHNFNIYCFYWKFYNGFNGELQTQQDLQGTNWELIHGIVMSVAWAALVDFGILAARFFRTNRLHTLYHAVMMCLVTLASVPMAIYMIVLHRRQLFYNFDTLQTKTVVHFLLGSFLVVAILILYSIGIATKILQQDPTKPVGKFLKLRKVHEYLGRTIYVLAKGQIILGWWIYEGGFALLIGLFFGWYFVLILLKLLLEVSFKNQKLCFKGSAEREIEQNSRNQIIESLIEDNDTDDVIAMVNAGKSYEAIHQAHPTIKFVHFKNKICDVTRFNHPGGASLLRQALGKDVSKFIYGGAPMEGNTQIRHRHTPYAIKYLLQHSIGTKPNIAKIEQQVWEVRECIEISPSLFKFLIKNQQFSVETNPKDPLSYLGKFWLITTASDTTRPYTAVLSQLPCNIQFRARLIQAYRNKFSTTFSVKPEPISNELPLMIKRYEQGTVSKEVHQGFISIEGLYGVGLRIVPGSNVIITGGTGILPFLDLFDLLLKKAIALLSQQAGINTSVYDPYKLTYKNLFPSSRFTLFASFTSAQQFSNYSWLVDLHQISSSNKLGLFDLWVKLPSIGNTTDHYWFSNTIDEVFFQRNIKMDARVFICGPPRMNDELLAVTQRLGYAEEKVTVL